MNLSRFLTIVAAALVILIVAAIWFFPLDDDFNSGNPMWNGGSRITEDYPFETLSTLEDLPDAAEGTTLLLIPYMEPTSTEMEQLRHFIASGGRLVLADDYGHGNKVLEYLGLEARFSGQVLRDPVVNYRDQDFPRVTHLADDPLTENVAALTFNCATCLTGVDTASTLASSSAFSFLDENDSGQQEADEPVGPLPVMSRHALGNGELILIADPSLFINSMTPFDDNEILIGNIAATSSGLYLDQSHLPASDLHNTKSLLAKIHTYLSVPWASAVLVALLLTIALGPLWRQKTKAPETNRL